MAVPTKEELVGRPRPPVVSADGPPVLVRKKPASPEEGQGEEEQSTPAPAAFLDKKLDAPIEVSEKAEQLLSALGSDCTKDVAQVRQLFMLWSEQGRKEELGCDTLDVAIRALFLAILNYEMCRKNIPIRLLQACNKASRISAYKCWSEVFGQIIHLKVWQSFPDIWVSVSDSLSDCLSTQQLLQRTSLSDLCVGISKIPEWPKFRRALSDSLIQIGIGDSELQGLLPY